MVVLDTNVVIAYLNNETAVVDIIDNAFATGEQFCVSAVTVTELLAYPKLLPSERERILQWTRDAVFVMNLDSQSAVAAGDLCRQFRLKTVDGIIAATALNIRARLLTRDSDFSRVPDLHIESV